ncbi:hypothetical protein HUJ04_011224 [Dendroctonus ponderosae]|nr:hypothetical protein HUJ04_011224 [Dendroctonus ponderosae]
MMSNLLQAKSQILTIVYCRCQQKIGVKETMEIPPIKTCDINNEVKRLLKPIEIFKKMFPPSLYIFIFECTNKKLATFEKQKNKKIVKPIKEISQ